MRTRHPRPHRCEGGRGPARCGLLQAGTQDGKGQEDEAVEISYRVMDENYSFPKREFTDN